MLTKCPLRAPARTQACPCARSVEFPVDARSVSVDFDRTGNAQVPPCLRISSKRCTKRPRARSLAPRIGQRQRDGELGGWGAAHVWRAAPDPLRAHLARSGLIAARLGRERARAAVATLQLIGLRVTTARSDIESVFRKTGVRRQGQFVALLKSARIPAFWTDT